MALSEVSNMVLFIYSKPAPKFKASKCISYSECSHTGAKPPPDKMLGAVEGGIFVQWQD